MIKHLLYEESVVLIDTFLNQKHLKLNTEKLNQKNTMVIIVDMLNGFAKSGALYSNRVEALIPKQVNLLKDLNGTKKVFLCDAHPENASEFNVFLPHCVKGTQEANIVEELLPFVEGSEVFEKNTTNGFLVQAFRDYLDHHTLKNIILMGCCTDLCIQQLALSLKTHYHHINEKVEILIPIELVDTYDVLEINHPGNLSHLLALKNMADNGILLMTIGEEYDMV